MTNEIKVGSKVKVVVKNAPKMVVIQITVGTDGLKYYRCAWFNTITELFNYENFTEEVLEVFN
ncbi:MAG: hypothetical protein ABIN89_29765 [Chitinophagaceae bacterium]